MVQFAERIRIELRQERRDRSRSSLLCSRRSDPLRVTVDRRNESVGDTVTAVWQIKTTDELPAESEVLDRLVGGSRRSDNGTGDDGITGGPTEPQLNDELMVQFRHRGGDGFVATVAKDGAGALVGYGQASRSTHGWTIGAVIDRGVQPADRESISTALFGSLFSAVAGSGGGEVTWWAPRATSADEDLARTFGMTPARTLLEMRCPLPLDASVVAGAESSATPPFVTRPFVLGQDDDAWLSVNNRAFAGHHEQGGWTLATLHTRLSEPWFAAEDLLLHELDGRLAGFCWMKLHTRTGSDSAPLGEIYVIGVDPDCAGVGLGRSLAVAGYRHITARGAGTAMLYVDDDNVKAIHLYESLGLRVSRRDVAYVTTVPGRFS